MFTSQVMFGQPFVYIFGIFSCLFTSQVIAGRLFRARWMASSSSGTAILEIKARVVLVAYVEISVGTSREFLAIREIKSRGK